MPLQPELYYRRNILSVLAIAGFFGALILASINIAREVWLIVGYEAAYAVYCLLMFRFTRTSNKLNLISILLVIPFFLIVLFAISIEQTALTICMWIMTIPIFAYLLLGSRLGLIASVVFGGAAFYLYSVRLGSHPDFSPMAVDLNIAVSTLAVLCCAHFYEVGRERAQKRLISLAGTDPLTGLSNRMRLEQDFTQLRHSAERYKTPLSLVAIDLDYFKNINDTYGHGGGDMALRNFAGLLTGGVRISDTVARTGGEEFVVLMQNSNLEDSAKRIDQLRQGFAQTPINLGSDAINMSFSAGVAAFGRDGKDLDELLKVADKRLYHAKAQGRNRVVSVAPFDA